MKPLPLEPAHWDESNGGGLIPLWSLDAEIFDKMSIKISILILAILCYFNILLNNSASNDRRRMKQLPLEPSHRDESNGSGLILLWLLDAEIIDKTSNGTLPHDVLLIISVSSGRRRMRPPPFDSSRWAGSNGNCFILLRSLDAEIFHKMYF